MQKQNAFPRRTFLAGTAALGAAAVASPTLAFATPTAAEKQAEADAALASLNNMQQSLDEASANYNQCLIEQEEAHGKMDEAQARIDEQTALIKEYQGKLSTRARSMYRTGSNTFLDVLLGSATFEEFASNWSVLNNMNNSDAQLVSITRQAREQVEVAKAEFAEQERIAKERTAEAEEIRVQAEHTVAEMQALYDSLSAEAAQLLEEERRAEEERQRAAAEAAMAEARRQAEEQERQRAAEEAAAAAAQQAATTASEDGEETVAEESGGDTSAEVSDDGSSSSGAVYEGGGDTVSRAYACLGAPYSWGAVGPSAYDCSGLVSYCISGSHTRIGTTYTFMGWPQVSNPQPGDICTNSSHCGIYIGDGQMIHASTYGVGVIVGPVQSGMIIVRA